MLIEIESIYGDKIIHGKHFSKSELQIIVKKLLLLVGESAFFSAFCARYGYEEVLCSDSVEVDYIIDLDTHSVIKPKY